MRNHTQNPSNPENSGMLKAPKAQKLQSIFNLVKPINGKKTLVCSGLTGEQVLSITKALRDNLKPPLIVKFAGMGVIA